MRGRLAAFLVCLAGLASACHATNPDLARTTSTLPGASATASQATDSSLADEQILRVAVPEPVGLDPTIRGDPELLRALQRPLVDFDTNGAIVPALAESWDISPDAKTLTFHLRDARYSNGDPIVAGDFLYSWRRLVDPRMAAPYAYLMADVVGGAELLAMAGARPAPSDATIEGALGRLGLAAPDPRTFIVHLNRPASYFLSAVTLWPFVPLQQKWITSPNATEAGHFVSSGPFILDTWDHESLIVLKPNPYWWGEVKPTLAEIRMSILGPDQAQLAYEAGELDLAATPPADVRRVRSDPILGAEYHEAPQLAINYYSFNDFEDPRAASFAHPGPTADRDFRIALTQAIDKQALLDLTWAGLGRVANSVVMPGIPGYQPDLDPYPYDVESAKKHMTKALADLGVGSAADLRPLKLGFPSGFDNEPRVAFLAEAWRQAFGLKVEQVGSDRDVFFSDRLAGAYDIAMSGWAADYPHAQDQLDGLFTCGGGNNVGQYCDPAFDALIEKAAAEPDQEKQVAIYEEAQTLLMNDAPILPLRFAVAPYEVKPYVSRLTVTPYDATVPGDYYFETIRILRH